MKTKRETYALLEQIYLYFDQFQINQQKIDSWHEALKDFSYEQLHGNLLKFVKHSSFPPKICDLISTADEVRIAPGTESMVIVGLRDASVKESREPVLAALSHFGG